VPGKGYIKACCLPYDDLFEGAAGCAKGTKSGDLQRGRHCQAKWRAAEFKSVSSWADKADNTVIPSELIHVEKYPRLKGIERKFGQS
jgi:hypothetical protein